MTWLMHAIYSLLFFVVRENNASSSEFVRPRTETLGCVRPICLFRSYAKLAQVSLKFSITVKTLPMLLLFSASM